MNYNCKSPVNLYPDQKDALAKRCDCISVAAALLSEPSVSDCAVLAKTTDLDEQELVAYVVPAESFVPERLQAHLLSWKPALPDKIALVPVSSVPLLPTGEVDSEALANIPVTDSTLVQSCSDKLRDLLEDIEQLAVVIQERVEQNCSGDRPSATLCHVGHTSRIVPEKSEANETIATPVRPVATEHKSESPIALSHGKPLEPEAGSPTTLPEALKRAALQSNGKGIVYIRSDGTEIFQSYFALLSEAQRILGGLRQLGLKPQDKVIFQLDSNQDFIPAIWGCFLGGFVPVPIAIAPSYQESNSTVNKLHHAWEMLSAPIVLTSKTLAPAISEMASMKGLADFRVETIEGLRRSSPDSNWHISQPDNLALLLLTSGSTGMPKGVMLSQQNILSMSVGTVQMNGFSSKDVSLNWMPLDHVGAIVFLHIMSVYLTCQQLHVPKETILQNPLKWLDSIERHRATISWAPNFAFSLLNDRAEEISQGHWDLSSMGFLVNAGEAIVAKTARRFLQLLAPHQLPTDAIHPAFGMSETCSGITWSDSFSLGSSEDETSFVELGAPIPGASLRIVDDKNCIVESGKIGRLQVKGDSVTSSYYQNPEANGEAFTDDGWFNTGDLGFIQEGRLTLTGRAKDVIIINGLNYYSHEIEAVVEELEEVEVSYTAACAVRDQASDSDNLAIFFHPTIAEPNQLQQLLKKIRSQVVKKIGVNPTYLIPVDKEIIPKTEIGKIQRSQLSKRFETGEFESILKQLDKQNSNAKLPDWFYRPFWRPKAVEITTQMPTGSTLLFADRVGLGAFLCAELKGDRSPCITVESGSSFAKVSPTQYRIDPKQGEHYRKLLASIREDQISIDRVLHLWTYEEYVGAVASYEELEIAQFRGVYSLLFLTQAIAAIQGSDRQMQLLVISSHSQPTTTGEPIAFENAPVLGLIPTIAREMPGWNCRHIDLPVDQVEVNGSYILQEMQAVVSDREVAYRNGQRLIKRLEKVDPDLDLASEEKQEKNFQQGGMYLLTGGLGGIGVEIAKYLLQTYQARLLLVGRTPLAPGNKVYRSLEQLGGEVQYAAVDICDTDQLKQVVEEAKSRWQCELDGIVHLAGVREEGLLASFTQEKLAATLRPKVFGTWVLYQLLKNQPNSFLIGFSSVNSFFGGTGVGAYAAANRFLDHFSHHLKYQSSQGSYCFAWSMWDEVGMSRGYQMQALSRDRGYHTITVKQGIESFLAGLHSDQGQLLIGLDGSKNNIRQYLEAPSYPLQKLGVYFTSATKSIHPLQVQVRDRFGTATSCELIQLQEMPLLPDGTVNRQALVARAAGKTSPVRRSLPVTPKTEVEKSIAAIWQEVLSINAVDVHDNFFDLGGNSLLMAQVGRKLQEDFKKEVSLIELLEYSTIDSLAQYLEPSLQLTHSFGGSPLLNRSQTRGGKRREKVLQQRRRSAHAVARK